MDSAEDLRRELVARSAGTPYSVSEMPGGLLIHLNVADLHWMTVLHDNNVRKEYSIELMLDDASHTYRREQIVRDLTWRAGMNAGTFTPEISAQRSVQRGTMVEKSASFQLGTTDSGRVGAVGYTFDSRQMAQFVDDVMKPSGWTKKMDSSTKLGLIIALSVVGGLVVIGLIVLVILLIAR